MTIDAELPKPPGCPPWCDGHEFGDGWEQHPAAVTKRCQRVVDCDGAEIVLERFASLDGYTVTVDPVVVRLTVEGPLNVEDALRLGDTLRRVAELAGAPPWAA